MAKRKKHQRLPSGWGSIRYLGKRRRNPYAVHPPCTEQDPETGRYIRPKPLCYVDDWYVGFAVLNAYRAGTYKPGDEIAFKDALDDDTDLSKLSQRILADSGKSTPKGKTLSEVYAAWYDWKCGENAEKALSESTKKNYRIAYAHLKTIHDREMAALTVDDLQACINTDESGKGTLISMRNLLSQLYKWAESRDIVDKDLSRHVVIPSSAKEIEHGIPLSEDDLRLVWQNRDDPWCELVLCLCYSGHRIGEYAVIEVDLNESVFRGGNKSKAGKDKIVPIHSFIRPLVESRLQRYGEMLNSIPDTCGKHISQTLQGLGIETYHTAHDCRHTFSALCEKYGVPENDRKRLIGHSFSGDITNGIYGHRTIEGLRASIELIPGIPDMHF